MCSQQKATQMLRGNTIPGLWEKLIKYKCLAPAQKRLPNFLVEGVGGGLEKDKINLFVVLIFYNDISQCFYCSFYLH